MAPEYEIYTFIPRNFDPECAGNTLDSIMTTSEGHVNHSVPLVTRDGNTIIKIETSMILEEKYIREQLDCEFSEWCENGTVVKTIRKVL